MLVHRIAKDYFIGNKHIIVILCETKLNDNSELTSINENVSCEKCLEEIKKGIKFNGIYDTTFMDSIKPILELFE